MANEEKSNQQEVKQLSYDELRKAAGELSMQLQRMSQQFNIERQKHQKETQELQMLFSDKTQKKAGLLMCHRT